MVTLMTLDSWGGRDVVTWGPGRKTGVFELDGEVTREAGGVTRGRGEETRGQGFLETEKAGNAFRAKPPGVSPDPRCDSRLLRSEPEESDFVTLSDLDCGRLLQQR